MSTPTPTSLGGVAGAELAQPAIEASLDRLQLLTSKADRAAAQLPPLTTSRTGWRGRFAIWWKLQVRRAVTGYVAQTKFNKAVLLALHNALDAFRGLALANTARLRALEQLEATLLESQRLLDRQVAALHGHTARTAATEQHVAVTEERVAVTEQRVAALEGQLAQVLAWNERLNSIEQELSRIEAAEERITEVTAAVGVLQGKAGTMDTLSAGLNTAHEAVADALTRLASFQQEQRERIQHLLDEQRVCFRQVSLTQTEEAVLADRARRGTELRLEQLAARLEQLQQPQ